MCCLNECPRRRRRCIASWIGKRALMMSCGLRVCRSPLSPALPPHPRSIGSASKMSGRSVTKALGARQQKRVFAQLAHSPCGIEQLQLTKAYGLGGDQQHKHSRLFSPAAVAARGADKASKAPPLLPCTRCQEPHCRLQVGTPPFRHADPLRRCRGPISAEPAPAALLCRALQARRRTRIKTRRTASACRAPPRPRCAAAAVAAPRRTTPSQVGG